MFELSIPWEMIPLFFLVALLYASVGHGGASGYLALFALFGIASPSIAPMALALNIVVATTSWVCFRQSGYFSAKLLLPFILTSIPAALLGGLITIPKAWFSLLLGLALLLAALRIIFLRDINTTDDRKSRDVVIREMWRWGLPIGAVLGLISGMIGIGGGVFLSPLLLLLRWSDAKQTAAVSSAFIVLNSMSGLSGHIIRGNVDWSGTLPLAVVVIAGGLLGAQLGALKIRPRMLQGVLAIVLVTAGLKLLSQFIRL